MKADHGAMTVAADHSMVASMVTNGITSPGTGTTFGADTGYLPSIAAAIIVFMIGVNAGSMNRLAAKNGLM